LETGIKNPAEQPGYAKRRAAFTATHAAMKTELFRAEKYFSDEDAIHQLCGSAGPEIERCRDGT
jgi:hypothetical protein